MVVSKLCTLAYMGVSLLEGTKNITCCTFDVVVVNLYPLYTSAGGVEFDDGIENIDIGGPAMIRAAAKNHRDVLVVVDTEDYPALLEFLKGNQDDQKFRLKLAWKAFQHVASYDSAVSEWLWKQSVGDKFPPSLTVPLSLKSSLRYGENPHQKAAFYVDKSLSEVNAGGIATAIQHHGKALAKEIREFRSTIDGEMFYEIVVAPSYTEKGLEILRGKSKTLRILEAKKNEAGKLSLRQVGGGWLAQDSDDLTPHDIKFNMVSEKAPQDDQLRDAEFAWLCVKHVKSNAIVIAKNNCMLGMGSGQPNHVESLKIAMRRLEKMSKAQPWPVMPSSHLLGKMLGKKLVKAELVLLQNQVGVSETRKL